MKLNKLLIMILSFIVVIGLAACSKKTDTTKQTATTINQTTTTAKGNDDVKKVSYRVKVECTSGRPLSGKKVTLKKDGKSINEYTDSEGVATFDVEAGMYKVICEEMPGYELTEDSENQFTDSTAATLETTLKYSQHLILESEATIPEDYLYQEGDSMYDFSVVNSDGVTMKLSELLEKNDLVVLNFWYSTCSYCIQEFPYLNSAYKTLKADGAKVELIAINAGNKASSGDTIEYIAQYKKDAGLSFPCSLDDTNLIGTTSEDGTPLTGFGISGFPTTIFVDRNGVAAKVHVGAITSETKWINVASEYLGDGYETTYVAPDVIIEPNVEYPGDGALESVAFASNFENASISNETGTDARYNWPWIVDEELNAIKPSNTKINNSYSIFHLTVKVPANKVIAMDVRSSCETTDILYVMKDGRYLMRLTGVSDKFESFYCYASGDKEEEITISFCYLKDEDGYDGTDTIWLKNFRFVELSDVDKLTYILRECAIGDLDPIFNEYEDYITPVYNETDGYYHVGNENGPLVLANLLDANSKFANASIYDMAYADELDFTEKGGRNLNNLISEYSSYASNSTIAYLGLPTTGLTPVTKELHDALVEITEYIGEGHSREWLEMCMYIDQYGTETDTLGDPIKGLATFSAYTANLGDQNFCTFDRPIIPRGLLFEFKCDTSGVYKIYSKGEKATDCYIYDANGNRIKTCDSFTIDFREFYENEYNNKSNANFFTYLYLEKGETYYISPCFWDIYEYSTLQLAIDYIAESKDLLRVCAYQAFVAENPDWTGAILNGATIKVQLGDDGYYHPCDESGKIIESEYIYADFGYPTSSFYDDNVVAMIYKGAFNFSKDEDNNPAYKLDAEGNPTEELLPDMTEKIKEYLNKFVSEEPGDDMYGLIKVDAELAEILQMLCDKYLFQGVNECWLKLCYYIYHLGA